MCYKVSQAKPAKEYSDYYKAPIIEPSEILPEHTPYYQANGFDHPRLAVITSDGTDRQLDFMSWGLLPPATWRYPKDKAFAIANKTLNARNETIRDLNSFKSSIKKLRGILPVEGFFEYKTEFGDKKPYFIYSPEKPFLNLACIYNYYQDPQTDEWYRSFSIVTGRANPFMAEIHNIKEPRQPIILPDEQLSLWMDPNSDQVEIDLLMATGNEMELMAHRVRRDLQKIGNDKSVLQPIEQ